jgi:hypothetical protein
MLPHPHQAQAPPISLPGPPCLLMRPFTAPSPPHPPLAPAAQREGDAFMAEIESVGQAYEDAQVGAPLLAAPCSPPPGQAPLFPHATLQKNCQSCL